MKMPYPKPGTGLIEKVGWAEPESRCLPVSDKSGSAHPTTTIGVIAEPDT